jgi:hypothetical protein
MNLRHVFEDNAVIKVRKVQIALVAMTTSAVPFKEILE